MNTRLEKIPPSVTCSIKPVKAVAPRRHGNRKEIREIWFAALYQFIAPRVLPYLNGNKFPGPAVINFAVTPLAARAGELQSQRSTAKIQTAGDEYQEALNGNKREVLS